MPGNDPRAGLNIPLLLGGFADLFAAAPEEADLAAWRGGTPDRLAPLLAAPEGLPAGGALRRACGVVGALGEGPAALAALNASFVRLFSGFGGPVDSAPPYESFYRGGGGRLFGASAAEMRRLLAAHGLALAADCHEAPDHLAVELLALAALLAAGDPAAAALKDRLQGWVPAFAAACAACDALGFYAALAAALEDLLRDGGPGL